MRVLIDYVVGSSSGFWLLVSSRHETQRTTGFKSSSALKLREVLPR